MRWLSKREALSSVLVPLLSASVTLSTVASADGPNPEPVAQAEPDDAERAKQHSTRGRELFEAGQYEASAAEFAAAFALEPTAERKHNEASAWEAAGRAPEAADGYAAALTMGTLDPEFVLLARQRLAGLREQLGVLVVAEPQGARISVGHAVELPVPARIHLQPGRYDVTLVEPQGARRVRQVEIVRGRTEHLRREPARPIPRPAPSGPPAPDPGVSVATPEGPHPAVIGGAVLLALGGAAGIASIPIGVHFVNRRKRFLDDPFDDAKHDEAVAWQTATSVTFYSAVGLAAVGALVLALGPDRDTALSFGPGGVAYRQTF